MQSIIKFSIVSLMIVLSTLNSNAQDEQSVTIPTHSSTSFNWKNGYGDIVKVNYNNLLKDSIDQNILKPIIIKLMVKSKYLLKNKLSYVPRELKIFKKEDGEFIAVIKVLGKNSYGAESELTAYYSFTLDGEIELISSR